MHATGPFLARPYILLIGSLEYETNSFILVMWIYQADHLANPSARVSKLPEGICHGFQEVNLLRIVKVFKKSLNATLSVETLKFFSFATTFGIINAHFK